MTPADEMRLGAQLAHAMAVSRRHTKFTFMAAAALDWSYAQTLHYIETGEQPAGKESGESP
jgi:hypothetical protein